MIYNLTDTFNTSLISIISYFFIIILSTISFAIISYKFKKNYITGVLIYSYSSLWGVIFLIASQYYGYSDSSGWITNAYNKLHWGQYPLNFFDLKNYFHNYFMYTLNLSLIFSGLDYLGINLIFNTLSSLGLLFFYFALTKNGSNSSKFFTILIIILLPSFMFWISGVSKDSIIFLPIGLALYYLDKFDENLIKFFFIIFIVSLIRPYYALILTTSALVFSSIFLVKKKNLLSLIFFLLLIFLVIILYNFVWNKGAVNIPAYVELLKSQHSESNTRIDKDLNFFLRILSYYFRPSIFDLRPNIFVIILVFENITLITILFFLIKKTNFKNFFKDNENLFIFILVLIMIIFFSQVTSNYGTAWRQKWMSLPFVFYLLVKNFKKD